MSLEYVVLTHHYSGKKAFVRVANVAAFSPAFELNEDGEREDEWTDVHLIGTRLGQLRVNETVEEIIQRFAEEK